MNKELATVVAALIATITLIGVIVGFMSLMIVGAWWLINQGLEVFCIVVGGFVFIFLFLSIYADMKKNG